LNLFANMKYYLSGMVSIYWLPG